MVGIFGYLCYFGESGYLFLTVVWVSVGLDSVKFMFTWGV